ncbi:unnamed protein product, partial [Effrenium voratum]
AAVQALERVRHRVCSSLAELQEVASQLAQLAAQGGPLPALLVIDSVAAVARNELGLEDKKAMMVKRQAALSTLAGLLKVLVSPPLRQGHAQSLNVVVTNQVMGDPSAGGSRVTLGHVWHHSVNWRLVLSHVPPGSGPRAVGFERYLL